MKSPPRKHKIKINGDIRFNQKKSTDLILKNMVAIIDDSTLKGNFALKDFDNPKMEFDLHIDKLNLDQFGRQSSSKKAAAKQPAGSSGEAYPVGSLKELNAEGKIVIDKFISSNMKIRNINIPIKAKNGIVQFSPMTASLYNGTTQTDITINVQGREPRTTFIQTIKGVQAGPLLKDLTGKERVTGALNFNAKVTSQGNTNDAMYKTMNGTAGFNINNGVIKGIDIDRLISMGEAVFNALPLPSFSSGNNETQFDHFSGTAKITNGIIHNDDLLMRSKRTEFTGQGTANMNTQKLDYRLQAVRLDGNLNPLGYKVPIRITGDINDPSIRPDVASIPVDVIKSTGETIIKGIGETPGKLLDVFRRPSE